jgi:hypothetical protein
MASRLPQACSGEWVLYGDEAGRHIIPHVGKRQHIREVQQAMILFYETGMSIRKKPILQSLYEDREESSEVGILLSHTR